MVVLDIKTIHGYLILMNHSLTSLVMLAPKFHRNLILEKNVIHKDVAIVKKGAKGTRFGRRLRSLSIHELSAHSRAICKKHRAAKFVPWYQKGKVAQLKMSRPSLKVSSLECLKKKDVFQFCSNILLPIAQMFLVGNLPCGIF
jgi:hypothetical protein